MKKLPLILIALSGIFAVSLRAQEMPSDVVRAREKYQKNLAEATQRYLDELARIQSREMMLRDTKVVLQVTGEINKVLASTMAGKWNDVGGGMMYINANGSLNHSNGATGTWVIDGNNLVLTWSNGAKHNFPIVKTKDILKGTRLLPGEPIETTLTRAN